MSLKVIELNDNAIRVGDESGIILQSPGFALAVGDGLELGDAAQQQARIQPTNSYNKYWHELSLEPISHGNGIRHQADIAYAHLLHLAQLGNIDADVIFAVPGNFTSQQLSILLGLAKQSPFSPVGLVDSALAAAISADYGDAAIFADIQLHQVVLTKLVTLNSQLKTDAVIQVPGVGSQNFMDLMMQLATGLFIQQCRFNPQHDAKSEQQLYNALPHWRRQDDANKSSLLLELKAKNTVHTAKMPRESLVNNLSGHYKKIAQQIAALAAGKDIQLLISSELAELPGFTASLDNYNKVKVLSPWAINAACLNYREHIIHGVDKIHLVNSIPVDRSARQQTAGDRLASAKASAAALPTHALFKNRAIAIDCIEIQNNEGLNGETSAVDSIVFSLANLPVQLGRIEKQNEEVYLDSGQQEFLLNQTRVCGRQKLNLGDHIKFAEDSEEIRLIQVRN